MRSDKRKKLKESKEQISKKMRQGWELEKKLLKKWKSPPKSKKPNYPLKNI